MSADPIMLALIRHGQSMDNIENIWAGSRTDSALSELGKRQAEATGAYLEEVAPRLSAIYTSPLRRAHDTAAAISKILGIPTRLNKELIEIDFGDLEGMTTEEVLSAHPDINTYWGPEVTKPVPGGESTASVARRAQETIQQIARTAQGGDTVIIVSHQGPITMGLATLLDDKKEFMRYMPSNCGVTWLTYDRDFYLKEFDHIEHLVSSGIETGK